jgi:predicted lipoprotein with Yx(FWY)xxD motif
MFKVVRSGVLRLALSAGIVTASVAAVTLAMIPAATAAPAAARPAAAKSAVVVKERVRPHVGKILVTTTGRALYYLPHGSCTGECLTIWSRLVMPRGTMKPKGASCLSTKAFGMTHRLQVTYRKHLLYTFADDSGISVTGNGVAGFKVAKVVSGRC